MENHRCQWENPLFLWSCSIAMLVITRGYTYIFTHIFVVTNIVIVIYQHTIIHQFYPIIWINYNNLTVLPNPGTMVYKRNHPQMAEQFRLVKYYDVPTHTHLCCNLYCDISELYLYITHA